MRVAFGGDLPVASAQHVGLSAAIVAQGRTETRRLGN